MIQYGLISKVDSGVIEKTLDLILKEIKNDEIINVTEVGIYAGLTGDGISEYLKSRQAKHYITGIDSLKDKEVIRYPKPYGKLIFGNSNEVYNQLEDNSQHLIIIDGNHSFPYVVGDYYCYEPKVKQGGYLCFHDIKPSCQGLDWQRIGKESDPDMSIAVRKALTKIGLLNNEWIGRLGWTKVFEEWDANDRCGGFVAFKKLY